MKMKKIKIFYPKTNQNDKRIPSIIILLLSFRIKSSDVCNLIFIIIIKIVYFRMAIVKEKKLYDNSLHYLFL